MGASFSSGELAAAWHSRHIGITAPRSMRAEGGRTKRCFEDDFCSCHGPGFWTHRYWSKAQHAIKSLLADKRLKDLLKSGQLRIECVRREKELEDTHENKAARLLSFIPLQSLKPWRPTLLEMTLVYAHTPFPSKCWHGAAVGAVCSCHFATLVIAATLSSCVGRVRMCCSCSSTSVGQPLLDSLRPPNIQFCLVVRCGDLKNQDVWLTTGGVW